MGSAVVMLGGAALVGYALFGKRLLGSLTGACVVFRPLSADAVEAIVQKHAPAVARKYRDGWMAAARLAVQSGRLPVDPSVIQCGTGGQPSGLVRGLTQGAQIGGAVAGGLSAAGVGAGSTVAGVSLVSTSGAVTGGAVAGASALGTVLAASTVFLAPLAFLPALFSAHHARAVKREQQTTCPAVWAANEAFDVIEVQAVGCDVTPAQYRETLRVLVSEFSARIGVVVKDRGDQCNLGCGLIRMMRAISDKKLAEAGL